MDELEFWERMECMRAMAFAGRNRRELLRDPLTIGFGLGFPLVLLALLSAIGRRAPVENFAIEALAPGVASFGLTFVALFSATLLARDRSRAFMARLCASLMRPSDFIFGYLSPMLALSVAQIAVCYLAAVPMGLRFGVNALVSMAALTPAAAMYVAIGLLCGTLLNDRQASGICGAVLTNGCAWLSGIWFDLALLGEGFERAANFLPFANAVTAARAAQAGDFAAMAGPLAVVAGYAAVLLGIAVWTFHHRLRAGKL